MPTNQTFKRTSKGWKLAKKTQQPAAEPVQTVQVVPGIAIKVGSGIDKLFDQMTIAAPKPVATPIESTKYKVKPVKPALIDYVSKPSFKVQPEVTKDNIFQMMNQAFSGKGVKPMKRI